MARKNLPQFSILLLSIFIGCGGNLAVTLAHPQSKPSVITADSVLNMGMIGQTWTFQNGYGEINNFEIQAAPPQAACRGGNNLVMHMTKTVARSYWGFFVPQAEIFFLLHQNPDGSWRSTASLINMPQGCPWCQPTPDSPFVVSSDVLDAQPGMPLPYLIAPPDMAISQQHLVNETRVNATGEPGLSYVCNIPTDAPLTGPKDGEYWRTDFYTENVSTPIYSGPAVVSDQFEGQCGHERWFFAPGKGIVKIESPYDGGQIKNDPVCANYGLPNPVHDEKLNIVRIM